jgi:ATP-dependent Lon protease
VRAVESAVAGDKRILLVTQIERERDEVGPDDLYRVGTLAEIIRVRNTNEGTLHVVIRGLARVHLTDFDQAEPFFRAGYATLEESVDEGVEVEALVKSIQGLFADYVRAGGAAIPELVAAVENATDPAYLSDLVASLPDLETAQRQQLLETLSPAERLRQLSVFLAKQVEIIQLKTKISSEVQREVSKSQREYILREQLKAIQKELGEEDGSAGDNADLRERVEAAGMPEEVKAKTLKEVARLERIPSASPEVGVIRTYVEWLLDLPWSVETPDHYDIDGAQRILDEDHYGLPKVKDRILEYMAVRQLSAGLRSPILLFVGPPGVGKTSLGKSIARAMGRKFVRMSLGGMRDEAEIRGHRRTYIGALPGRIIQGMKNAGTRNPVFMLDEIDKVGTDWRGDPSSALLEVLDPEQNNSFTDHYLEVPFDLSKVVFIATANVLHTIPPALRDRMEVISLPGYTEDEKIAIARRHLVPKQLVQHGLAPAQRLAEPENAEASASDQALSAPLPDEPPKLEITDGALQRIVREYTREAGVRSLEREIANVARKAARKVAQKTAERVIVEAAEVPDYLGPERFEYGVAEERDQVGVVMGLAVTEVGGDTLSVEASFLEGGHEVVLTGQLGKVMEESARAALSYARAHASALGVPAGFFNEHSLHVHVPAGAIPKDGPSAGVTMTTAIVSALTGRPVRADLAMTGEVTLRGKVLPIGGLKEKALAAHRAGIRTVLFPRKNQRDLHDFPEEIREEMTFIPVDTVDEVLDKALLSVTPIRSRRKAS